MSENIHIIGISGSLRKASLNTALLKTVQFVSTCRKKPWINIDGGGTEDIMNAVRVVSPMF